MLSSRSQTRNRAVGAIALSLALLGCEVETKLGTISLLQGSQATTILRTLGVPRGAVEVSEIDVMGPDGPMPEIALRSFAIRSTEEELRADFSRRCKAAGLGKPDSEMLEAEPSTLCSGQIEGGRTHLLMSAECPGDVCHVALQVQRLAF